MRAMGKRSGCSLLSKPTDGFDMDSNSVILFYIGQIKLCPILDKASNPPYFSPEWVQIKGVSY
jgi:hypothetical protein